LSDQAVELTQEALGNVASQTRAVGERAAKLVGVELPKKASKAAPAKKARPRRPFLQEAAPAKKAAAKKVTRSNNSTPGRLRGDSESTRGRNPLRLAMWSFKA